MIIEDESVIVIHTPTPEEYKMVVEWAISKGIIWGSGSTSINEFYWDHFHESKTCIVINQDSWLSYCTREYALTHFTTDILSIEQFFRIVVRNYVNEFGRRYNLK